MGKKNRAYSKPTPFKSLLVYFVLFNVVALAYLTYSYNSNLSSTSTLNADQGFTPRITQEVNQTDSEYHPFHMDTVFYDEADQSLSSDSEPDMDFLEEIASNLSYQGQVSYAFENPQLAYKALTLLDVFEPVNDSYFGTRTEGKNNYHVPWMGVINDDAYCEKNRAHFVEYPEFVFEDVNFITSSPPSSIMRNKAIPGVGTDIQPHIGSHMPKSQKEKFMHDLRPDAMVFFALGVSPYKHIGKNFACLAQTSGHVPGHESFSRKDFAAESAINYAKLYEDKPQCFNHDKFFPKTWVLYNKENCEDFFEKFNSEDYKKLKAERNIVYIRKVGAGSHRGQGVFTVNDEEEALLRKMYKNGTLCGTVQKNYIVQNYVHNGLLLEGRKFDFRMYLLVASTNPLIAFYHDGFLRVSLAEYDSTSNDKKVTLTNLALNKQIYDEVKAGNLFNGMDEEDLKLAQQWSFERLHKYLMSAGIVTDENWLDNYLRPEFKKAMIHLMRMSSHRFLKRSSIYELYGVDFMLDTNLNLWFIEANSGPALGGYSVPMEKFIVKMIQDHFEVVVGLLRSRMKRVINYVNILTSQGMVVAGEEDTVMVKDLKKRIAEFKIISQNKFELEFEPSAGNGFAKIIDENFQGIQRYQGFIAEECLDSYEEL